MLGNPVYPTVLNKSENLFGADNQQERCRVLANTAHPQRLNANHS